MSKPVVVLLGPLGSGKTTVFNALTGQAAALGHGAESEVEYHECETDQFIVRDTPGFASRHDVIKHTARQLYALVTQPVNLLAIVVSDLRASALVTAMHTVLDVLPLDKVAHACGVVVTHSETRTERDKALMRQTIQKEFGRFDLHDRVVFTDATNQLSDLGETLASWCSASSPVHFALGGAQGLDLTRFPLFISATQHPLVADFMETAAQFRRLQDKLKSVPDHDRVHVTLMAALRQEAVAIFTGFAREADAGPEDLELYLYIAHDHVAKILREFCKDARSRITYSAADVRETMYRRCPKCELVWCIAEGCSGPTKCGARVWGKLKDFIESTVYYDDTILIRNGRLWSLNWERISRKRCTNGPVVRDRAVHDVPSGGVGCGMVMSFDELEPLQPGETDELVQREPEMPPPPPELEVLLSREMANVARSLVRPGAAGAAPHQKKKKRLT